MAGMTLHLSVTKNTILNDKKDTLLCDTGHTIYDMKQLYSSKFDTFYYKKGGKYILFILLPILVSFDGIN